MANRLRKLKRYQESLAKKKEHNSTKGMTKQAMWYECRDCGKRWRMWLELGLEEHGDNHKPVPFTVRCKCGGTAYHVDWKDDLILDSPRPILEQMNYFANKLDSDCGVPVLR